MINFSLYQISVKRIYKLYYIVKLKCIIDFHGRPETTYFYTKIYVKRISSGR